MADDVTQSRDQADAPGRYEKQDVKASGLAKFAIGLAVGIAISMVLMAGLARVLSKWITGGAPVSRYAITREERLPPLPRQLSAMGNRFPPDHFTDDPQLQRELEGQNLNFELQPPERYREVYDRIKQRELTSYGAIAKQPGQFHIPIEEAKRRLLERGGLGPAAPMGQAATPDANQEVLPTAASAGRAIEKGKQ